MKEAKGFTSGGLCAYKHGPFSELQIVQINDKAE